MGAILLAFALLAALTSSAIGSPIYGTAKVVDGDTLTINGERIRLHGIDAPELDQTCTRNGKPWQCGREAADRLSHLVLGKSVRCIGNGTDAYGRTLARCDLIGIDINQAMVASGYAVAYRKYSTEYVAAEERAQQARIGLWAGSFEVPSDYRSASRRQDRVASSPAPRNQRQQIRLSGACAIKGNHSRRGEWIYHLPGMPYYDQTRPEEIFCTEAQAQAAGYRRAIVR